jgi:hypothetical protein
VTELCSYVLSPSFALTPLTGVMYVLYEPRVIDLQIFQHIIGHLLRPYLPSWAAREASSLDVSNGASTWSCSSQCGVASPCNAERGRASTGRKYHDAGVRKEEEDMSRVIKGCSATDNRSMA